MGLDFDSIIKMPAIVQVISHAIEEGRLWEETFINDSSWWDNKDRRTFAEINKVLGIKLISKTGEKTLLNIAKIIPGIGCVIGGTVNGVMMNACGHSVVAFIKAWKRA